MGIGMKAARIDAGYTQEKAAVALGVSKSTLCNYENGKTVPDITIAKRIARLYNRTVDEINFFED